MNDIGDVFAEVREAWSELASEVIECHQALMLFARAYASYVAEKLDEGRYFDAFIAENCANKRIKRLALRGKTRRVRKKNLKRIFDGRV